MSSFVSNPDKRCASCYTMKLVLFNNDVLKRFFFFFLKNQTHFDVTRTSYCIMLHGVCVFDGETMVVRENAVAFITSTRTAITTLVCAEGRFRRGVRSIVTAYYCILPTNTAVRRAHIS